MNLYRVTLRGMQHSVSGAPYGIAYVVATDAESAYQTVRAELDRQNVGFSYERQLDKIELVAEEAIYPASLRLYFAKQEVRRE